MRYAIVSDIHANWQAWSAVRDDIYHQGGVDCVLCLGDVVGYGPQPERVFDDVMEYCGNFVLGNHDAVVCGKLDADLFNDNARYIIDWTCQQLGDDVADHFYDTPMTMGDADLYCAHAEAGNPDAWGYIFEAEHARSSFELTDANRIFVGHTHKPMVVRWSGVRPVALPVDEMEFLPNYRYLVNVGSVGDPRDGDPTACYCLFDTDEERLVFRRLPFDYAAFKDDLDASRLPVRPFFLDCLQDTKTKAIPLAEMAMPDPPAPTQVSTKTVSLDTVQIRLDASKKIKKRSGSGGNPRSRARRRVKTANRLPRTELSQEVQQEQAEQQKKRKTAVIIGIVAAVTLVIGIAVLMTLLTKPAPAPAVAGAGGAATDPGVVDPGTTGAAAATTGQPTETVKPGELTAEQRAKLNAQMQANVGTTQAQTQTQAAPADGPIPSGTGVGGRYVRITVPGDGKTLTLIEVQVYANRTNVSAGKTASQSSVYNGSSADRALDGNIDGTYRDGEAAHTESQKDPWWEVDLGNVIKVNGITVYNRTDCCGDRLDGYIVELLDAARKPVWRQTGLPTPTKKIGIPVGDQAPAPKPAVPKTLTQANPKSTLPYALSAEDSRLIDMSGNSHFAIFARFKTTKRDGTLVAKTKPTGDWSSDSKGLLLRGGQLSWEVDSAGVISGGNNLNDGKWHNVALKYGQGLIPKLFVDGKRVAERGNFGKAPDRDEFVIKIGEASPNFGGDFDGQIAEVAIFRGIWSSAYSMAATKNGGYNRAPVFKWTPKNGVTDVAATEPKVATTDVKPPPPLAEFDAEGLLVHEPFEYETGKIASRAGGKGWSGPWKKIQGSQNSKVYADSLSAELASSGVPTTGGHLSVGPDARYTRPLKLGKDSAFAAAGLLDGKGNIGADGKTVYISAMLKPEQPLKRYYEFEIHRDNPGDQGRIGGIGTEHSGRGFLLRNGLKGRNDTKTGPVHEGVNFVVIRVDFKKGRDAIRVYMNPALNSEPGTPSVKSDAGDYSFDAISIGVFDHKQELHVDEIRLGTSWAAVIGRSAPTGPLGDVAKLIARKKFLDASKAAAANAAFGDLDRAFKMKIPLLKTFHEQRGKTVEVAMRRGRQTLTIKSVNKAGVSASSRGVSRNFTVDDLAASEKLKRLGEDDPAALLYVAMMELNSGSSKSAVKYFNQAGTIGKAVAVVVENESAGRLERNAERALKLVLAAIKSDPTDGNYEAAIAAAVNKKHSISARKNFPRMVTEYVELYGDTTFGGQYTAMLADLSKIVADGVRPGLLGRYYKGREWKGKPVATQLDPNVDFVWGGGGPKFDGLGGDEFSIHWTGYVRPDETGTYTIECDADDSITITFDGKKLGPTNRPRFTDLKLTAGRLYSIDIRYFEGGGGAKARVEWENAEKTVPRQPIPAKNFVTSSDSASSTRLKGFKGRAIGAD